MELTVGKFARAVDTTIRTLRHYEQIGLLVPHKRNEWNQKIYARDELKRFYNIQLLKSLNIPLHEIKQRLEEPEFSFRDMLEVQEAVLLDKRNKINRSLEMITRIKHLINEPGDLNNGDLMLLMNSIRLEENHRMILNQYFPSSTVDTIMPQDKSQQQEVDLLNIRFFSFFKAAIHNELMPESDEVQRGLKELLEMVPISIDELSFSDSDLEQQLEMFKALLPVEMEKFVGEVLQVFYKEHDASRDELL